MLQLWRRLAVRDGPFQCLALSHLKQVCGKINLVGAGVVPITAVVGGNVVAVVQAGKLVVHGVVGIHVGEPVVVYVGVGIVGNNVLGSSVVHVSIQVGKSVVQGVVGVMGINITDVGVQESGLGAHVSIQEGGLVVHI